MSMNQKELFINNVQSLIFEEHMGRRVMQRTRLLPKYSMTHVLSGRRRRRRRRKKWVGLITWLLQGRKQEGWTTSHLVAVINLWHSCWDWSGSDDVINNIFVALCILKQKKSQVFFLYTDTRQEILPEDPILGMKNPLDPFLLPQYCHGEECNYSP